MGDKYIIELESGTHIFVLGPEGIVHIGEPDVVYETVDGMQIGDAVINAEPYTEPDLEHVRMEAYEDGYKTAKIQCGIQAEKDMRDVGERHYQRGLNDAWDAARKIALDKEDGGLDTVAYCEIFGYGKGFGTILKKFSASEAIEKIRQYEQEKEEIKVGDEVIAASGKAVIIDISDNKDNARYIYSDSTLGFDSIRNLTKTGRHFPEIATILEKMRGEQYG